ncbi:MAG TPA: acetyl-CoA carboxylase biotin carboxyl carrier protein [Bacillales bacterium]|nr:acetyl-CoA carboxylase biotin carboxyl carrier protein [Bacillales bacterium]
MKIQEIRELIKLIDQSSIHEFEYEQDGTKISLKKQGNEVQAVPMPVQQEKAVFTQPAEVEAKPATEPAKGQSEADVKPTEEKHDENLHKIESPMVGTFYSSPSPDADVYVQVGDKVKADTVVCIVEAMKLFNEIEADVDGEIVEILVGNGELVEYGQPLFLVKPQ